MAKDRKDQEGRLTLADLEAAEQDERYLGYGYLQYQDRLGRNAGRVNRAVVKAANQLGFTYDQLFEWLNSKLGRWYAEDAGLFRRESHAKDDFEEALSSMEAMLRHVDAGTWS